MLVLIADDDESSREALGEEIRRYGATHTVVLASNGAEALALVERLQVNLVISDIQMPEMTGLELLGRVKAFRPELPVILMSGFPPISLPEALRRGALTLLTKPFSADDLAKAIRSLAA